MFWTCDFSWFCQNPVFSRSVLHRCLADSLIARKKSILSCAFLWNSWRHQVKDKNTQQKTMFAHSTVAEPCFFYEHFNQQVFKTLCFCSRSGLIWSCRGPPGSPPGLLIFSKSMQKIGFWKHGQEKARKNTGFCAGESSKPRFLQHILVAKKHFHGLLLVHLPSWGPSWAPPQPGQKMVFSQ